MNDFPRLDECLLAWLGAGRWRVLGCRLKPLTLMHRELLRMAGSGLITGGRLLLPDVELVVQICRRDPREAALWLARPRRCVKLRTWWRLLCYGWRMPRQFAVLKEWLESCENAPAMLEKEREESQAPGFQRDAPALLDVWVRVTEAGFPAEAVVNQWPAGLARWLFETLNSREGGRKFETETDREMMQQAREMRKITEPELPPVEAVAAKMRGMMAAMRGVNR